MWVTQCILDCQNVVAWCILGRGNGNADQLSRSSSTFILPFPLFVVQRCRVTRKIQYVQDSLFCFSYSYSHFESFILIFTPLFALPFSKVSLCIPHSATYTFIHTLSVSHFLFLSHTHIHRHIYISLIRIQRTEWVSGYGGGQKSCDATLTINSLCNGKSKPLQASAGAGTLPCMLQTGTQTGMFYYDIAFKPR